MDLWDTILESENKFLLEADDDEKEPSDKPDKDNSADSKNDTKKEEPKESLSDDGDSGKDEPEDTPDNETSSSDDTKDDASDDGASDDNGDEPPDQDGIGDGDSDTGTEEPSSDDGGGEDTEGTAPEQDGAKNAKVNSIVLLDNFISLYKMINSTVKKISESRKDNILASVTFNQVKTNLEKLSGIVYKYITLYYDRNDHTLNLYNFKYFMEILKLNLEMIRKVTSTNKETETSI